VGDAQLLSCVEAPLLAPQPLAVQEVSTGELRNDRAAPEPIERLAVQRFGGVTFGQ
jgi:hypothetical protein